MKSTNKISAIMSLVNAVSFVPFRKFGTKSTNIINAIISIPIILSPVFIELVFYLIVFRTALILNQMSNRVRNTSNYICDILA